MAATALPISRSPPPAPTPATGHSGQTPDRRIDVQMSVPFTDEIGHRATKYLTWLVAFKIHMASRAFRKGPPANVKELHIMLGGTNVDGLSIPVPPKPKRKEASAITCSPSKLQKNNVSKDFNDDITAIMEEVVKCGASETSDEYYMATKLFVEPSNRCFFYAMKTNAGRLHWLKRHFEERK